jgi:aminoglycoside phosphotransferase (APT) family kinase protein
VTAGAAEDRRAQVARLAERLFGERPRAVERMPHGFMSLTFDVRLRDRSAVVRTHHDPAVYRGTEANIRTLARLGVPVARVLDADLSLAAWPFAYLVLERLPGRDLGDVIGSLRPAQMTAVAEAVTDAQRRVAGLPAADGFGYAAIGEPPPHATWWDALRAPNPGEGPLPAGLEPLAARVDAALASARAHFDAVPPRPFLDDLTTKNVIVEGGRVSGFVDFDVICYGDPLLHLGLTQTAVESAAGERGRAYVGELLRLAGAGTRDRRLVDLYAAACAVGFMREGPRPAAWVARMSAAAERWIGPVGRDAGDL